MAMPAAVRIQSIKIIELNVQIPLASRRARQRYPLIGIVVVGVRNYIQVALIGLPDIQQTVAIIISNRRTQDHRAPVDAALIGLRGHHGRSLDEVILLYWVRRYGNERQLIEIPSRIVPSASEVRIDPGERRQTRIKGS